MFSNSSKSAVRMSPFSKFSPRSMHTEGIFQVKLSCQIGELLIDLVLVSDDIQPIAPKGIIGPLNGSPHRLSQGVFPSSQEVLDAFHGISPPFVHPILTVAVRLKFFPSLYITLGLCDGSRNFLKLFSVSCEVCFARVRLNPLIGKILYHDSVPMIVP